MCSLGITAPECYLTSVACKRMGTGSTLKTCSGGRHLGCDNKLVSLLMETVNGSTERGVVRAPHIVKLRLEVYQFISKKV